MTSLDLYGHEIILCLLNTICIYKFQEYFWWTTSLSLSSYTNTRSSTKQTLPCHKRKPEEVQFLTNLDNFDRKSPGTSQILVTNLKEVDWTLFLFTFLDKVYFGSLHKYVKMGFTGWVYLTRFSRNSLRPGTTYGMTKKGFNGWTITSTLVQIILYFVTTTSLSSVVFVLTSISIMKPPPPNENTLYIRKQRQKKHTHTYKKRSHFPSCYKKKTGLHYNKLLF